MGEAYEEITYDGKIIAMILRADFQSPGLKFFSPEAFSQQLGYLPHKKGKRIPAHFHREVQREITRTQEVLFVRKGRVKVDFYSMEKKFLESRDLNTGDVVFLCSGGHGFTILEDSEMIEVKQGPYSGKETDKVIFEELPQ